MESKTDSSLSQEELERIFVSQNSGDYTLLQESQERLKATYLDGIKNNWNEFHKKHPEVVPLFDIKNSLAQEFKIDGEIIDKFNLDFHFETFNKISDISTAGVREFYNPLYGEDPSYMYNDIFLSLLIEAEVGFLKDLHREIKKTLESISKEELIKKLRIEIPKKSINYIEEIYKRPLEEIISFLKETPVKLIGHEVRALSERHLELESRILAANGITVLTTEVPTDSMTIYMSSFLCYLLGTSGGTNYTPSHSAIYVNGRKALAANGAQLLPDVYKAYRENLKEIFKIARETGYTVRLSASDDSKIIRRLSYKRMAALYSEVLAFPKEFVKTINEATEKGHRIILNCVNGCTWKTIKPLLEENGINPLVFELLWAEENPYFSAGYIVIKDKETQKYFVDHLGIDTTIPKVVRSMPYPKLLEKEPLGRRIYECDPDSDRFVLKQIVSEKEVPLLEEYGIIYYPLSNDKILASPSPNKIFLELDVADYERMKENGEWENYFFVYFPTYVSAKAWQEFAEALKEREGNISMLMCRVGFKNFNELQQKIESWLFNKPEESELCIEDQLGRKVVVKRGGKGIRILSKEEESGGRVAGLVKPCMNVLGQRTLAMPEKSAGDSLFSELYRSSVFFLKTKDLGGEYLISNSIKRTFEKYGLEAKIDYRIDILHGDQGLIAQKPVEEQKVLKERAEAEKNNFNNFFFSLGSAVRQGTIKLERVGEILEFVIPQWVHTWKCTNFITLTEEPLSEGRKRPEGVPITFKEKDGCRPLVLELDFRPSATDALKSKVYIDAKSLPPKIIREIERMFGELKSFNLYEVLEKYEIESILPKSKRLAEIGLKSFF